MAEINKAVGLATKDLLRSNLAAQKANEAKFRDMRAVMKSKTSTALTMAEVKAECVAIVTSKIEALRKEMLAAQAVAMSSMKAELMDRLATLVSSQGAATRPPPHSTDTISLGKLAQVANLLSNHSRK